MGNLHSRIPTRGTSSQPMPVTVVGGGTSGTEYTDGQAVPANPTAPSLVYDNSGNWQHVSAANPLPVTGGGGGQQYTSGATVPATQIGNALEWSDGVNWQTTSTAKPLPVTIPASSPIAVSLASYQTTIPVSLASLPVPVSGSFFQTIQPVSLASILVPVSLASLPVPVSGAFFQATQPVSLTSLPVPVSLASLPVPVSGTFFQTTQPISLVSAVAPVSLASLPVPVSGTFWQTTQSVSLASLPVPVSLASVPVPVSGTFWQTTQPISLASTLVPISLASVPVPISGTLDAVTTLSQFPAATALGDTLANPTTTIVGIIPLLRNGVGTFERADSITTVFDHSSVGIPASGMVSQFNDVTPQTVTERNWGNLRISTNRNLYNTIRDAGGNERGANVNASSQLSVSVDNNPTLAALPTGTNTIGSVNDQATVTDSDQSYTLNTSAALTIATNGRLRVESDRAVMRLDELNYIQNYITDINTMIASESENSQRAGYEMR